MAPQNPLELQQFPEIFSVVGFQDPDGDVPKEVPVQESSAVPPQLPFNEVVDAGRGAEDEMVGIASGVPPSGILESFIFEKSWWTYCH